MSKRAAAKPEGCVCGSGQRYAQCCEPFHLGMAAPSAEALMRSRYSAYVLGLRDYLLSTWHASTRPTAASLDLDPATRWLGLRVLAHRQDSETAASVEFVARFAVGGGSAKRLHERSRFAREAERWYYVDGEFVDAT